MSITNIEVIKRFVEGKDAIYSGKNIVSRDGVLLSYREPMIYRKNEDNLVGKEEWFLINGDMRNRMGFGPAHIHLTHTFGVLKEMPRVSFSALRRAGIDPLTVVLVDYWRDERGNNITSLDEDIIAITDKRERADKWGEKIIQYKKNIPAGATVFTSSYHRNLDQEVTYIYWHKIGSVLLYKPEDKSQWLCSMDEGSYFVSKLPYWCNSIVDAFKSLKPLEVQEAEREGKEVKRQGEWFFIPVGKEAVVHPITKKPLSKDSGAMEDVVTDSGQVIAKRMYVKRGVNLREKDSRGTNIHHVTALREQEDGVYIAGWVRHWMKSPPRRRRWGRSGNQSGEHKAINLGDVWHKALCNKSLEDYSSEGRVD